MHDIVSEISSSIKVHAAQGSRLGGIHLELTGDVTDGVSVTECTGGSMELGEEELQMRYESYCDREPTFRISPSSPTLTTSSARLNFEQSLGSFSSFLLTVCRRKLIVNNLRCRLPSQLAVPGCAGGPSRTAKAPRARQHPRAPVHRLGIKIQTQQHREPSDWDRLKIGSSIAL